MNIKMGWTVIQTIFTEVHKWSFFKLMEGKDMKTYKYKGFRLEYISGWWWSDKLRPWHFRTIQDARKFITENGLIFKS